MGVKTGVGGLNLLGRDVNRSDTKLGQMSQTLAKAKSTGSGIGGLLGGIIGQILIPIPGVGAAIGAGLGSLAGSKIGGATSGASQGDILNTKFRKESAHNITKQVAQQEFANVAKSTLSGFMQGINPASSLSKFGKGFETGAGMGTTGIPGLQGGHQLVGGKDMGAFMGGVTGGFGEIFKKAPSAASTAALPKIPEFPDATNTEFPGMPDNPGPWALDSPGPWANASTYPDGEIMHKRGGATVDEWDAHWKNEQNLLDMATQGDLKKQWFKSAGQNPNADPAMQARIKQYMESGWAPDDTIDMNLWEQMGGQQ